MPFKALLCILWHYIIIHSFLDFLHELEYCTMLTILGVTVEAILWTPLLTPFSVFIHVWTSQV